ncbi:MAG: NADH:flavin oxidoreductase [Nevskia sp.]|jgi:2,4-dienoyl-CoA reductase-like NADH-dependent reductase (Old Yellow Enzyme family)|nr:NADH:flavin oxidoreductase [Nevskia sp.]MCK9384025.1 NADH:flavin oxidoreductase [Nevskia sp.]
MTQEATTPIVNAVGVPSGSAAFPQLFRPLQLRGVTLKNRLFFPAMGIDLAHQDGTFSGELSDFYWRIARSGCGLVVLSNASVSPRSILQLHGLRLFEPAHAAALGTFLSGCAADDAVIAVQLQHYGGQATTTHTGLPLLTPSGIGSAPSMKRDAAYRTQAMTHADIADVVAQFAQATRLAVEAGARFVQLQASNGYLLASFLSQYTNKRDDAYGGSPERRAQFVVEVVRAVRRELGPERALGLRIGINDCIGDAGLSAKDFRNVAPLLEAAGVDLFEASISIAESFHRLIERTDERQAFLEDEVGTFKAFATVPVGFAGFVDSLAKAERYVASGLADTVGMARALFADNDLIHKTLAGQGATIDRCLWDGKCFKDKSNPAYGRVYCCVNPRYKRPALS